MGIETVVALLPTFIKDAAWLARFLAWRAERDARRKASGQPPSIPPGTAAVVLLAMTLFGCRTVGPIITDVAEYCQERPWECGGPKPTAVPTIPPAPVVTPTPVPATATPTPTGTPTAAPTASPTVAPLPTMEPCAAAPPAPPEPVSVLFAGRCPHGFDRVEEGDAQRFAPPGTVICAAKSTCPLDGHSACPGIGDRAAWAFGYNLAQGQELRDFGGAVLIYDAGRGCKDAYGRFFHEKQDCRVLYTNPTDPRAIWTYTGIAPAAECTPAPTPAPTSGPTPVPPAIPQPADFRASIVAACQELHYTEVDGGSWKGKCDSTIRYAGTLRSGEFIRSTCDWDHQHCAVDSCPDQTEDQIAQHRKVHELCGGNEWYTPNGTLFFVHGAQRVEPDRRNSYQVWIWGAPDDHNISLYACIPPGARRDDGVPIPMDGQACGGEHPVTFEAPR